MVSTLRQRRDAERKARTRRALLDAAKQVFVAKGYHATLISDVAARAGTGQGTFYRHFDNKRRIFEVLFDEFMALLMAEFSDMSARPPTGVDEYMAASRDAVLRAARIALAWTVPIQILPVVTTGILLNAIAISLLIVLSVLAAIGEYVMRNFLMAQRYPGYVIREIYQKEPPSGVDG